VRGPSDPSLPAFVDEVLTDEERGSPSERRGAGPRAAPGLVEALANLAVMLPAARWGARPPAGSRERLLAVVRRMPVRYAPFYDRLASLFDLETSALVAQLERSQDASAWEALGPGSSAFHLRGGPRVAGADVGLVRVEAGRVFPEHRHLGHERVLVLEGGYRDSAGHVVSAGDFHEMERDTRHSYKVLAGGPLVVALVLFGGVEFERA
jgi:quercetin dioxygenase-like cupin family protein